MAEQERFGRVMVTTQYRKDDEEEYVEEQLEVRRFPDGVAPAHVTAKYGMTLNLGNYESARCDVSVTLPCFVEEIDDAFTEAWGIAKTQIRSQTKNIKKR